MPLNLETLGRWLFLLGGSLAVIGAIIWAIGHYSGWENFPGNLKFQSGPLTCVIPILGSIILSILLTLLLNFFARLLKLGFKS